MRPEFNCLVPMLEQPVQGNPMGGNLVQIKLPRWRGCRDVARKRREISSCRVRILVLAGRVPGKPKDLGRNRVGELELGPMESGGEAEQAAAG